MSITATSAAEAIASIPEGARVVVPPGPAHPAGLLQALGERSWNSPIELYCGAGRLPKELVGNSQIRIFDWQFAGGARELFRSGRIDYVPLRYSDFPRAFGPGGALEADVLLMQVPPIGPDGSVSPGLCGAIGFDIVKSVKLVIAEVNQALPFTFSPVEVHVDDLDFVISVNESLGSLTKLEASLSEVSVALNVAGVVSDGATLQFGTGSVIEAVLGLLGSHKNLGIHSGMVTEGILPLIETGVINNVRKGYLDGRTVAGMVGGSPRFLRFIDKNPEFLVVPAGISHGHDVLAQLVNFTTINSAVEIDLTGQVNAEFMKGSQFSGVGGQADYTFAGSTSQQEGCKAIIAMPSTTAGGAISRIVPALCPGAIVTTPRYCVDFVVTDFGVADLRFQPLDERAKRLIGVAHPEHRESLEQQLRANSAPREG
jgi:4-hydroxybutyrate CoA-transferase